MSFEYVNVLKFRCFERRDKPFANNDGVHERVERWMRRENNREK